MIAAPVQGDVDGIPQGSHYASVPMIKPIGRLVGSATATLEDRLTAAVSTPNPSADGLQRDLLWVSGLSLVAVAPDLCVAAGESDRPAIEESQKVLIVETWVLFIHRCIALRRIILGRITLASRVGELALAGQVLAVLPPLGQQWHGDPR